MMVVVFVRFFHFMGCMPHAVAINGNIVIFSHSLTSLIDKGKQNPTVIYYFMESNNYRFGRMKRKGKGKRGSKMSSPSTI